MFLWPFIRVAITGTDFRRRRSSRERSETGNHIIGVDVETMLLARDNPNAPIFVNKSAMKPIGPFHDSCPLDTRITTQLYYHGNELLVAICNKKEWFLGTEPERHRKYAYIK